MSDWPEEFLPYVTNFLAEDYLRPGGEDSADAAFASAWFFPLQRRYELRAMMGIARQYNPATVMEIGADKGAGVYQWCKCLPTVNSMIAIEIRGTPYAPAMEQAFPHICFKWMNQNSHTKEAVQSVREYLCGKQIDVLFIDGDKAAFHIDFDFYLPLMNPNGVVFMHDIHFDYGSNDQQPRISYDLICRRGYSHQEIIDTTETKESFQRAAKGIPPSCPHEGWLRHWKGAGAGVGVIYLNGYPDWSKI